MDPDVTKHLFEPFFTTKAAGEGTGLGLATVFGVVKQSGGGIYVYSEPGRGSTFKIYLPAATAEADGRGSAPEPAAERGTETIMVVEDDDGVRALVKLMLEANGYEVFAVGDAESAERLCTERTVDLLLTDVVMPEVSGSQLAERLRGLAPSMRILFMSGYSDEAVQRHGELTASAAFLEKPFTEARTRAQGPRGPGRLTVLRVPAPSVRVRGSRALDGQGVRRAQRGAAAGARRALVLS